MRFVGFPIYSYSLNIMFIKNEETMLITIPTVMSNKKQILKLFSNLEIKTVKKPEEEK